MPVTEVMCCQDLADIQIVINPSKTQNIHHLKDNCPSNQSKSTKMFLQGLCLARYVYSQGNMVKGRQMMITLAQLLKVSE